MKKLPFLLFLIAVLVIAWFGFNFKTPAPAPAPAQNTTPIAFTAGAFTTQTIPITVNGTTYSLSLNASGTLSLVAATAQGQKFLNNKGNLVFQLTQSSTSLPLQSGLNCSNVVCSIDVSPFISTPGTYQFTLFLAVAGVQGSVTGTINVP